MTGFLSLRDQVSQFFKQTHIHVRHFLKWGHNMIRRSSAELAIILCLAIATSSGAVAPSKYVLTQDPQAVAVAKAAFTAMGGAPAVAGYQDSLASGTITLSGGGTPISYPITMKSKGLYETRIEIQMAKGTNTRIMNQGQAVIQRPDGTVRGLYSNNTFSEHVEHVPLLSVLAEIAN